MAEPAYGALPDGALKRVRLSGLEAIYHARSGITHLLAEPVPDLLDSLASFAPGQFVTPRQLLARISERFDILGDDPAEAPEAVLGERLAELATLGLVESQREA